MQQYRVEFFQNAIKENTTNDHYLKYVYNDTTDMVYIDDDYLAVQATIFEIRPTTVVQTGHLVRLLRDEETYFFGIVTNVEPTDYTTKVTTSPFISIFDESILFDTAVQGKEADANATYSLENVLKFYIEQNYKNNTDSLQNYPIEVVVPEDVSKHTQAWDMDCGVDFLREDGEGAQKVVINMYETLIVNALKVYGIAINSSVNFTTGLITLTVGKIETKKIIDGDLDNVKIPTLKVNDRPKGVNKLIVYNANDYSMSAVFYVHPNRQFDVNNTDRILPVSVEITTASPDADAKDQELAFAAAAIEAAYQNLSGLEWDDLIELQCATNDAVINPMLIKIGQLVTIYYKDGIYSSILTGRTVSEGTVTLIFGSERITFTKKRTSK